jgi:GNAT superfamily N-acetyltransferase
MPSAAPGWRAPCASGYIEGATFAYLADVFIVPAHRGLGLGKRLMAAVMAHPELQGLRRFMLATRDAHGLYRQFGFKDLKHPQILMERHDPELYQRTCTE